MAVKVIERVLKEFLAQYGKDMDIDKEEKRSGKSWRESAPSIVADYHLPFTAIEFSNEIMPLCQKRQALFVFLLPPLLSFLLIFPWGPPSGSQSGLTNMLGEPSLHWQSFIV